MIDRYTRPRMGAIWSEERKLTSWLAVELAVCEAWHRRGRIPDSSIAQIRHATVSLPRMREIERETDHDVIAFLRAVSETVGDDARFIHLGLTSSDVVDTGLALQAREAGRLLEEELNELMEIVGKQAVRYKDTITVGRTHGMHAEPTTFGLKLAVWFDELRRHSVRLRHAIDDIAVGKISGAVGTHAHVPPDLENEVCASLDLDVEPASTQVVQRDRHAYFLTVLAGIGASIEKFGTEIRHLQRTEVGEVEEPFGEGNQGSSAMPHKRNPHASERLCGLARLLRGYAMSGLENVALWHERDISHSSVERVVFPDSCVVLDYMLGLAQEILSDLVVYPARMQDNLTRTGGLIYSQQVLLALVDAGMDRQQAYRLVQRHAHATGTPFRDAIARDEVVRAHISEAVLNKAFDPTEQLQNVDATFQRLGLLEKLVGSAAPSRS